MTQRGRWARKGVAVAAAVLFIASTFAHLQHFLPLTHAVCDQHGELVHVEPGAGPRSTPHAAGLATVHATRSATSIRGHEHCAWAPAAHGRSLVPQPGAAIPIPTPTPSPPTAIQQAAWPVSIPCHRVAPKQSPPA
jgi:hypothetical protein